MNIIKILLNTQSSNTIYNICKNPISIDITKACNSTGFNEFWPKLKDYNMFGINLSKKIPSDLENLSFRNIYELLSQPDSIVITRQYLYEYIRNLIEIGECDSLNRYFNIVPPRYDEYGYPILYLEEDDCDTILSFLEDNVKPLVDKHYKKIIENFLKIIEVYKTDWNPIITEIGNNLIHIQADPIAILELEYNQDKHNNKKNGLLYRLLPSPRIYTPEEYNSEKYRSQGNVLDPHLCIINVIGRTFKGNYIIQNIPKWSIKIPKMTKKIPKMTKKMIKKK